MVSARTTFSCRAPKRGNSPEECEDAFALFEDVGRFALADGASDAIYSSIWAEILVNSFVDYDGSVEDATYFDSWLDSCRAKWSTWERAMVSGKALPWFTRQKLEAGSAAAFIGLLFQPLSEEHLHWKAVAYGDCCLFIVQEDLLRLGFPIDHSEGFNNAPPLLRTAPFRIEDGLRVLVGSASPRDRLYLATDALAQWFCESFEAGDRPWKRLDAISSTLELEGFVEKCRSSAQMRNDDVSLVRIECQAP